MMLAEDAEAMDALKSRVYLLEQSVADLQHRIATEQWRMAWADGKHPDAPPAPRRREIRQQVEQLSD